MKNLQMNVKVCVEYDSKSVRHGPEFLCSECGSWFKKLIYWTSKKFNPDQQYQMVFLCGPQCATEKYERESTSNVS